MVSFQLCRLLFHTIIWIVFVATTCASSHVEGCGKLLVENRVNFQTSDLKSDSVATKYE
jgi:hypothetical protein